MSAARRAWLRATEPVRLRDYEHSVQVGAAYVLSAVDLAIGAFLHSVWGWWMVALMCVAFFFATVAVGLYSGWKVDRGDWREKP